MFEFGIDWIAELAKCKHNWEYHYVKQVYDACVRLHNVK
jgi:hypothetical protein